MAFFAGLGFETEGRTVLEGEFLDTVTGMPNSRTEIVMLRPPGGGTELVPCQATFALFKAGYLG